jgi:hypothetical protein
VQILNALVAQDLEELGDGTLNIFGIIGGLRVTAVPYVESHMKLFIHFSANPGEFEMEKPIDVQLWAADGDLMRGYKGTVIVPKPLRSGTRSDFHVTIDMNEVPFIEAGDYGFHILVESVERTVPFYISVEEGEG